MASYLLCCLNQIGFTKTIFIALQVQKILDAISFAHRSTCTFFHTMTNALPLNDSSKSLLHQQVDDNFLKFSKSRGNDLSTPMPMYSFPGLKEGDRWCLW